MSNYKKPKEAGKRLAESNHKKREAKKREERAKLERTGANQYYGIGVVIALGVIGGLGYYIYRTKKVEQPQQNNPKPHSQMEAQTNKFEMDQFILGLIKLVAIVATSEMTTEYLIKQKILPDHINV